MQQRRLSRVPTVELPPDPWKSGDRLADLLEEGAVLREAVREASERCALPEAVAALSLHDLRVAVLSWTLTDRFRDELDVRRPGGAAQREVG
jgi:hypothetical protein